MYTHSTIEKLAQLAAKLGAVVRDVAADDGSAVPLLQEESSMAVAEARYKANDASGASSLVWQLICCLVGCAAGDMGSNALRWALAWVVYVRYGRNRLFLLLPILLALAILLEAWICIVLKKLIVGKLEAGRYPLWGSVYFRWLCTRHIIEKSR